MPTSLLRMRLRGNGSPSPLCLVPEDAFSTSSSGSRGGGSGGGPRKQQHFFSHQTLRHHQLSPYENFLVYAEPIYASVAPSNSEFDASISPRTFPFQNSFSFETEFVTQKGVKIPNILFQTTPIFFPPPPPPATATAATTTPCPTTTICSANQTVSILRRPPSPPPPPSAACPLWWWAKRGRDSLL